MELTEANQAYIYAHQKGYRVSPEGVFTKPDGTIITTTTRTGIPQTNVRMLGSSKKIAANKLQAYQMFGESMFEKGTTVRLIEGTTPSETNVYLKTSKTLKVKKVCPKCEETHRKFGKFCSRKCANSRNHSETIKRKISKSLIDKVAKVDPYKLTYSIVRKKSKLKKKLRKKWKGRYIPTKSANDSKLFLGYGYMSKRQYRLACKFRFALNHFPDYFDFSLIEEHGWYSPTNKNNNLGGVSRDHILSVMDGYSQGIDPEVLSHPANCRLMVHSKNISKNSTSDVTFLELLRNISVFNDKYGYE